MDRIAKIKTTGILKIELGKEIFERTGLTGTPIRSGGRKHGKERFCMYKRPRMS
jgi:ribonuclease P/MRP protein subunit RPP40